MTKDEIIRMAIKCQLVNAGNREGLYMDALAEFAEMVAMAERETFLSSIKIDRLALQPKNIYTGNHIAHTIPHNLSGNLYLSLSENTVEPEPVGWSSPNGAVHFTQPKLEAK